MAMKELSIFPKSQKLKPHYQMVLCHIQYTWWGEGLLTLWRDAADWAEKSLGLLNKKGDLENDINIILYKVIGKRKIKMLLNSSSFRGLICQKIRPNQTNITIQLPCPLSQMQLHHWLVARYRPPVMYCTHATSFKTSSS